tara:strand:+ start:3546 stop:4475 length:930 start_codon:yes stop_codon:yes gene_type:complete
MIHYLAPVRFSSDQVRYLAAFSKADHALTPDEHYITNFYNFFLYDQLGALGSILLSNIVLLLLINNTLLKDIKGLRLEEVILLNTAFVFLSFMNKEIIAIFLVLYLVFSKNNILIKVLLSSFYAYFSARYYWFIFLIMFLINKVVSLTNRYSIIISTIIMVLVGNIFFYFIFDHFLLEQRNRTIISLWYHNPDPINTEINWLHISNDNHVNSILNYLFAILTVMIFPFIYFLEFKIHLIFFYLVIYYLIYYFFFVRHDITKYEDQNIIILMSTFILTLLIFEPDLGSFARHLGPVFTAVAIHRARNLYS